MKRDRPRILILSDSLAAPRSKDGQALLTYEETWPFLLRDHFPSAEVIQLSVGHATSEDFAAQCPYWLPADPDIVFYQAGLNDILPRALHKHELEFAKQYPLLGRLIHRFVGRFDPKLRRWRNISYLSERRILASLETIRSSFQNTYSISVVTVPGAVAPRFASVEDRAKAFNECAKDVFGEQFISLDEVGLDHLQADGFHLNNRGHKLVLSRVVPIVAALIEVPKH